MTAKTSAVLLALLCAFFMLPSPAAADTITMRLLGLKDSAPVDEKWNPSESVAASPAVVQVSQDRTSFAHSGADDLLLGFPSVLTSHQKVHALLGDSLASLNAFSKDANDTTDGRRSQSDNSPGGGFGGLGSTAYGRTLRSSIDGSSASESVIDHSGDQPAAVASLSSYGDGGGAGSVLDDQLATSLETNAQWDDTHASDDESAVGAAFNDDQLKVPQPGRDPLLDVKPWVSGYMSNAVDEGQFVVVDPVSGAPVWTTDTLDELLAHGSLTPLVPTWEGPSLSLGGIPNPEPASLILFASGLLGVGARYRASRRSKERR